MRYFVLIQSQMSGEDGYIVAEVVKDPGEPDEAREISMAGSIAGPMAEILTREELLANPARRRALEAWEREDDRSFEAENTLLDVAEDGARFPVRSLRVVHGFADLAALADRVRANIQRSRQAVEEATALQGRASNIRGHVGAGRSGPRRRPGGARAG